MRTNADPPVSPMHCIFDPADINCRAGASIRNGPWSYMKDFLNTPVCACHLIRRIELPAPFPCLIVDPLKYQPSFAHLPIRAGLPVVCFSTNLIPTGSGG